MMKTKLFLIVSFLAISINVYATNTGYTIGGYPAALSEDLLDRMVSLSSIGDDKAMQEILNTKLVIILRDNIHVEIVGTKLFKGMIKIRPIGTNIELWTVIEAVKR